tara:strand:- start:817 stop:1770 length:954 start_codon:yes stop_codon:yes gene_type:complete
MPHSSSQLPLIKGALNLSRRNLSYIERYNAPQDFLLADDKLKTKYLAKKNHILTSELFAVIHSYKDLQYALNTLPQNTGFVIKPSQGSAGKGILIIVQVNKKAQYCIKKSGDRITYTELYEHVNRILEGEFTLGRQKDIALMEREVHMSSDFKGYSFKGLPDIRFIVFLGFPIMAMLRLSTQSSDGKANLHQGAIGVGLDITTGEALQAIQYNQSIYAHPDTGLILKNIKVPRWNDCLTLSASCYNLFKLGFMGVDIALNQKQEPILLEVNARPGLSIQNATGQGLIPWLNKIESQDSSNMTTSKRVEYVKKVLTIS